MGLNVNYFAMSATVMGKPVNLVTNKLALPTQVQIDNFSNTLIAQGSQAVENEFETEFGISSEELTAWGWAAAWAATETVTDAAEKAAVQLDLVKKTLVQKATAAMEFQMEPGDEFDVTATAIQDFVNDLATAASSAGDQFGITFPDSVPGFDTDNLVGLSFRVRDLAFSALPTFKVKVDVSFSPDFIKDSLGIPDAITEVITISKFGVGMEYSKD